ncbi:hypothetical protein HYZ99_01820 [Candidatus Peregrinibacteria bacterium]|nr:hypothetical protein [Candidatus Peregrinibacteria bacterium]
MHVRFSTCIGFPVTEDGTEEHLGSLIGILIHPDTGKVEGFFVRRAGLFGSDQLFLSTMDILRWGMRVDIRSEDALSTVDEHIRLQPLLLDRRPVLGQKIRTESGLKIGTCRDVQFDTRHFVLEWLFPKKFFRWGTPLPLVSVSEVRRDAIIIRDVLAKEPSAPAEAGAPLIPQFPEVAEARTAQK